MGRKQKHPIVLSEAERQALESIVKGGEKKVRVVHRAQALLWSDAGKSDLEIADLLSINPMSVAKHGKDGLKSSVYTTNHVRVVPRF